MKRAWGLISVLIFTLFFLLNPVFVEGFSDDDVTIIPLEGVSVDSPLLVRVDPETTEKPIRITWSVYNTGNIGVGSFPIVDGKGLCYFSNEDGNATCGPSPFWQAGETELYIFVVTQSGTKNVTIPLNISSMQIDLGGVNREDNTVYMFFYGKRDSCGAYDCLRYTIWNEDLSVYQQERSDFDYDISLDRYNTSITLNSGVYYFSFYSKKNGIEGTALKRIDIPSGDFLAIDTDKNEYWTGEKITISGTTNANTVKGAVYFPDDTKAEDFTINVKGDNTFSYDFSAQSDWPEGEYEIKTTQPLVKIVEFSITEFFKITPESVSEIVNKSDDFTETIEVKNLRSNSTNVSISTTGDMEDSYVDIDDTILNPQETAIITIDITNVESDIDGTITISTSEGLELEIPISINAVEGGVVECPPCLGGKDLEIDRDYVIWSQECVVEEEITSSVLITNNGDSEMTDFEYEVEDTYTGDQSLESLDSYGYIDIDLSEFSIDPEESEYLDMKITPPSAGKYQGLLILKSGGEAAFVFVDLNCFEDISDDLTSLSETLSELNPSDDVSSDIDYDITQASDHLSLGNYQMANEYYEKAKAKLDTIQLGGGGGQPVDFTWAIIVIVIVVVVLVVVWFLKFKRPQISKYEEETESLEGFE